MNSSHNWRGVKTKHYYDYGDNRSIIWRDDHERHKFFESLINISKLNSLLIEMTLRAADGCVCLKIPGRKRCANFIMTLEITVRESLYLFKIAHESHL